MPVVPFHSCSLLFLRWDGKIVKMDRAWLEDVCGSQDLLVGAAVDMPWRGKGGKTAIWKGVISASGCFSKQK